jgi:hypothetical protein
MGTLGGFAPPFGTPPATPSPSLRSASPNLPALWLRRAKPASANAVASPHIAPTGVPLMNNAG